MGYLGKLCTLPDAQQYKVFRSSKFLFWRQTAILPRSLHASYQTGTSAGPESIPPSQTGDSGDPVKAALESANAAAATAETALDSISKLPSARVTPKILVQMARVVKRVVVGGFVLLVCAHLLLTQDAGMPSRLATAITITLALSLGGYAKKSLNISGAIMAIEVGFVTILSSYAMGGILLGFFITSSLLTRVSTSMKRHIDAEFKEGGQRDWKQVACNGAIPSLLALLFGFLSGFTHVPFLGGVATGGAVATALQGSVLGYYACCCGDTWASEIGVLSPSKPRLITSGRVVRRGTNGAVSLLGLIFSALGGLVLGLVSALFCAFGTPQGGVVPELWKFAFIGLFGGLFGSLVDSLFGATLQFSGYNQDSDKVVNFPGPSVHRICGTNILTNNQVNLLSACVTALCSAGLSKLMF